MTFRISGSVALRGTVRDIGETYTVIINNKDMASGFTEVTINPDGSFIHDEAIGADPYPVYALVSFLVAPASGIPPLMPAMTYNLYPTIHGVTTPFDRGIVTAEGAITFNADGFIYADGVSTGVAWGIGSHNIADYQSRVVSAANNQGAASGNAFTASPWGNGVLYEGIRTSDAAAPLSQHAVIQMRYEPSGVVVEVEVRLEANLVKSFDHSYDFRNAVPDTAYPYTFPNSNGEIRCSTSGAISTPHGIYKGTTLDIEITKRAWATDEYHVIAVGFTRNGNSVGGAGTNFTFFPQFANATSVYGTSTYRIQATNHATANILLVDSATPPNDEVPPIGFYHPYSMPEADGEGRHSVISVIYTGVTGAVDDPTAWQKFYIDGVEALAVTGNAYNYDNGIGGVTNHIDIGISRGVYAYTSQYGELISAEPISDIEIQAYHNAVIGEDPVSGNNP